MNVRGRWLRRGVVLFFVSVALVLGRSSTADDPKEPPLPPRVPDKEAHRPTALPDRIILTPKGDPATSQAVTWRTDPDIARAFGEVALAEDGANFAGGYRGKGKSKARRVQATTTPLEADLGKAHYHSVEFSDLKADTQYVYRVGDGTNWSEWFQFRTASMEAKPFTFLYFGDAQNAIKAHWSRVVRQAVLKAPDARLLIHAGDLVDRPNSDAEWGEWHVAAGWINGSIASLPSPGNHEWFDANAPKGKGMSKGKKRNPDDYRGTISRRWRPQFCLPENGPAGQEEQVYYVDYQGTRFISLNSNKARYKSSTDLEEQARWVEKVLKDNPNRWTVIVFHHPMFSPAKKRDNPDLRKLWKPIFDKYRVDLVLTGHDHTYARSGLVGEENAPAGAAMMEFGGTVYCVSVSGPKFYELNVQDWMVSSAEGKQLFQVVRVEDDRMRYEAYTATGVLHDLFELRKQASGRNRLVERAELEAEAAPPTWWEANRWWAIPAGGAVGVVLLLWLARLVWRR